jgi:hypothetical protein
LNLRNGHIYAVFLYITSVTKYAIIHNNKKKKKKKKNRIRIIAEIKTDLKRTLERP